MLQINAYLLVLIAVFLMGGCLSGFVIIWLRIESFRGDIADYVASVKVLERGHNTVMGSYESFTKQITDATVQAHATQSRVNNLEESLVSLTNKWISRERVERKQAKQEQTPAETQEIPGTEQQVLDLPFPFEPAPKQQQQQRVRKFGEIPAWRN